MPTPVAQIHSDGFYRRRTDGFGLLHYVSQCVSVVRVARVAAHANDKTFFLGTGNAYLGTELKTHSGLALADAIHVLFVQRVELVLHPCIPRLLQQAVGQVDQFSGFFRHRLGNLIQLALQFPLQSTYPSALCTQCLTRAFELFGMGKAADLLGKPRILMRIGLANGQSLVLQEYDKLCPQFLQKATVGRICNVLLHHCGMHADVLKAAALDGSTGNGTLHDVSQQPLQAFFAPTPTAGKSIISLP